MGNNPSDIVRTTNTYSFAINVYDQHDTYVTTVHGEVLAGSSHEASNKAWSAIHGELLSCWGQGIKTTTSALQVRKVI